MNKHRQQRPTNNTKYWAKYITYRLVIALLTARARAMARANNNTKHTTRNNFKK